MIYTKYLLGVIIFLLINLICSIRKVKESEVYIIERNGNFLKTKESGFFILIPFIDRIKNIVDTEQQVLNCYDSPVISNDNKIAIAKIHIIYHIIDSVKATYEVQNLKRSLELLAITSLRDIVGGIENNKLEYLKENIQKDLKFSIYKESYNWGCVIDYVKIEFVEKYSPKKYSDIEDTYSNTDLNKNYKEKFRKFRLKSIIFLLILLTLINIFRIYIVLFFPKNDNTNVSNKSNQEPLELEFSFKKGTVIDSKKNDNSIGLTYAIELNDGEKIELYNESGLEIGKKYNVVVYNYYKKYSHTLYSTEYLLSKDSNTIEFAFQEIEYFYDYSSQRVYKLNIVGNSNYNYSIEAYYNDTNNVDTLYNFIRGNQETLDITDNFDIINLKRNDFKRLEKINTYSSEYGNCYILKAIKNENEISYFMYIDNKYKRNENELDGIFLYGHKFNKGYFETEEQSISSFKWIVPEKTK